MATDINGEYLDIHAGGQRTVASPFWTKEERISANSVVRRMAQPEKRAHLLKARSIF